MKFVVLSSKPESAYADTPTSYEFPAQYRQFFAPLERGESMLAIIYEPLARGAGRMAYVGWAALSSPPTLSSRVTETGRPLWEVRYVDRVQEFPTPVPRDLLGEPIESWLRQIVPANRAIRTSGASVRGVPLDDATRILELGHSGELVTAGYGLAGDHLPADALVAERTKRLVTAIGRDARFRRGVMSAYEFKCSISGFGIGELPLGRATRLIDAAHIRPVNKQGSDSLSNGLALTPTLHRLFDEGLFTVVDSASGLTVVTSPHLEPTMISSPDASFALPLTNGLKLRQATTSDARPSTNQLRFHQHEIFRGPESLLP